ncbi:hypothetical protein L2E82_25678 [Cichorium intybus]|uniref:Uncharacterized protein n=1 Tax=Cichorium intybus TaxID=13427 RepID=A0ACB9E3X5_CICIN|nr:hypothetical protein L2E82_25678 [Cichorium intybus]
MAGKLSASVFIFLLSFLSVGTLRSVHAQKTWCVAKPSSSLATLVENINFACSQVDCGILQKGGACSTPDNVHNHASVAMNLYYQSKGRNTWNCQFGNSGLVTVSDPSYGGCPYVINSEHRPHFEIHCLLREPDERLPAMPPEFRCRHITNQPLVYSVEARISLAFAQIEVLQTFTSYFTCSRRSDSPALPLDNRAFKIL